MNISEKIKTLPQLPGVYKFVDQDNEIIYIGKSNNIRHRVMSYFSGIKEGKIKSLVRQIDDLQIEVCDTHLEARLLECQRIKEVKPPYNSQFKRERGFVYLKIGRYSYETSLSIVTDPSTGLGPFRNRQLLEMVVDDFRKLYPLRIEFAGTCLDEPAETTKLNDQTTVKGQFNEAIRIRLTYSLLPKRLEDKEYDQTREALERLFCIEPIWQPFLNELDRAMLNAAEAERFQEAIFFRDFKGRLELLHRLWFEDKQLFGQLIFLWIPIAGGVKYFRIQNGSIEDLAIAGEFTKSGFEEFCRNSRYRLISPWADMPDRAKFDFWGILYSEIRALPQDQVIRRVQTKEQPV